MKLIKTLKDILKYKGHIINKKPFDYTSVLNQRKSQFIELNNRIYEHIQFDINNGPYKHPIEDINLYPYTSFNQSRFYKFVYEHMNPSLSYPYLHVAREIVYPPTGQDVDTVISQIQGISLEPYYSAIDEFTRIQYILNRGVGVGPSVKTTDVFYKTKQVGENTYTLYLIRTYHNEYWPINNIEYLDSRVSYTFLLYKNNELIFYSNNLESPSQWTLQKTIQELVYNKFARPTFGPTNPQIGEVANLTSIANNYYNNENVEKSNSQYLTEILLSKTIPVIDFNIEETDSEFTYIDLFLTFTLPWTSGTVARGLSYTASAHQWYTSPFPNETRLLSSEIRNLFGIRESDTRAYPFRGESTFDFRYVIAEALFPLIGIVHPKVPDYRNPSDNYYYLLDPVLIGYSSWNNAARKRFAFNILPQVYNAFEVHPFTPYYLVYDANGNTYFLIGYGAPSYTSMNKIYIGQLYSPSLSQMDLGVYTVFEGFSHLKATHEIHLAEEIVTSSNTYSYRKWNSQDIQADTLESAQDEDMAVTHIDLPVTAIPSYPVPMTINIVYSILSNPYYPEGWVIPYHNYTILSSQIFTRKDPQLLDSSEIFADISKPRYLSVILSNYIPFPPLPVKLMDDHEPSVHSYYPPFAIPVPVPYSIVGANRMRKIPHFLSFVPATRARETLAYKKPYISLLIIPTYFPRAVTGQTQNWTNVSTERLPTHFEPLVLREESGFIEFDLTNYIHSNDYTFIAVHVQPLYFIKNDFSNFVQHQLQYVYESNADVELIMLVTGLVQDNSNPNNLYYKTKLLHISANIPFDLDIEQDVIVIDNSNSNITAQTIYETDKLTYVGISCVIDPHAENAGDSVIEKLIRVPAINLTEYIWYNGPGHEKPDAKQDQPIRDYLTASYIGYMNILQGYMTEYSYKTLTIRELFSEAINSIIPSITLSTPLFIEGGGGGGSGKLEQLF